MRAVAKILRARASEHPFNFCEQFEQRPIFASTFKLNGTIRHPSYACWFLSLHFESCCIQKPHIFQPFSLFTIEALPRIFGYFCTMSFSYVTLHIWPSGGLMRTIGENIDKTAFTSSARKKKRIQYFSKIFSKMSSWKIWKSTKRKQIEGLGAL